MSVQSSGDGAGRVTPPVMEGSELAQQAAVRRYGLADAAPDPALDRIAALAARMFNTPIAAVSIVDGDRVRFVARTGLDLAEVERETAPCHFATLDAEPMVTPDASADPRMADNTMVAGGSRVRFYAAAPLQTPDGGVLGTLCVAAPERRDPDEAQMARLTELAVIAMDYLAARSAGNGHKDATIRSRDETISDRDATIRERDATISERDDAVEHADTMAREVDHRVKNDLQFIASLLSMQARGAHPEAAESLNSAASRVSAVARVHQHISVGPNQNDIACLDYLKRLCADIAQAMGERIDVQGAECDVPTRKIGKLGMLTNELVTNAIKHGDAPVTVHYGPDENGGCTLTVSDGGPGLPEDFDPDGYDGLGMRVIRSLAQQIEGELHHANDEDAGGAVFRIRFTP